MSASTRSIVVKPTASPRMVPTMVDSDSARLLERILDEADSLIRQRMKEADLDARYLVAAAAFGVGVMRGNAGPEFLDDMAKALRGFVD